jgi:hypothetical protein
MLSQQPPPPSKKTTRLLTLPPFAKKENSEFVPGKPMQVGERYRPIYSVGSGIIWVQIWGISGKKGLDLGSPPNERDTTRNISVIAIEILTVFEYLIFDLLFQEGFYRIFKNTPL